MVEGLLPLIVSTAETGPALAAHGINFINEDDARRAFFGLLKQVAHPTGAHTHKHLDKLRTGDREEGNASFPGHGLGEQGFTRTRRAHQQHALGDFGADGGETIGVFEEVDNLGELELGALNAGHITKGDLGLGLHLQAGLALAEAHGGVAAAPLGPAQQEEQTSQQQKGENQTANGLLPRSWFTAGLHRNVDVVVGEQLEQVLVGGQVDHGTTAVVLHHLGRAAIGRDQHPRHLIALHRFHEVAVAQGARSVGRLRTIQEGRAHGDHHDHQEDIEPRIAPALFHGS